MAIVKRPGEGAAGEAVPSPPLEAGELRTAISGEGSLLSGRRERRVNVEQVGFSSLQIRVATEAKPGSWLELRLGKPFPEDSWVAGLVRSCTIPESEEGSRRSEFVVDVELHAVADHYFRTTYTLISSAEQTRQPVIVFTDSDAMARSSLSGALRGAGELRAASSRAEFLQQLGTGEIPDVLILPTRLADADGIALVRSIAAAGWYVPTILLTNQLRIDAPRAAKELGRWPHRLMEKPVGREQLRAELSEMITEGRAERRSAAEARAHVSLYSRLRDTHRRLRQAVGGYLDTRVLDRAAPDKNETDNKTQDISIVFVDIRNSTKLIDQLPPKDAVSIVNRVLTELAEAVETHGGMVDKFLGDGLMGLFGVSGDDPHHAHRALAAARSMVHRIKSLNQSANFPNGVQIGVGVGIQSGSCILGSVGSQFRKEFTALGAPVNVAARLQALAGAHEIVLPAALAANLQDVARFESMGEHPLKGFEKPVEVVRVVD